MGVRRDMMQVAKYWRNNKLRYRLIKSAGAYGRKREVKRENEHAAEARRQPAIAARKA